MNKKTNREGRLVLVATLLLGGTLVGTPVLADMPAFESGSTGADGALDLTGTPANSVVEFDPVARNIDPEKDNVFNFTTITIPAGVTLKLTVKKMPNAPVYFLATGAVNIAGTLDLSGQNGHAYTTNRSTRIPSLPGPGGFAGGLGGSSDVDSQVAAQNGLGPAAGIGNGNTGNTSGRGYGLGAGQGGNKFLVPLIGGSGGGGALNSAYESWGAGGGAGGGAILIASSVSVTIASGGKILANGGNGGSGSSSGGCYWPCYSKGGSGAGGAVRLVAPVIDGAGRVEVSGWSTPCPNDCTGVASSDGRVRIEAFNYARAFGGTGTWAVGSPISAYVPSVGPPAITVVSVGGHPISNPTGEFTPADVTINTSEPTVIAIRARNIPVGTIPKVRIFSLEGPDQEVDSTPLQGSLQDSTATATVTFPAGFTRGYVRAKW